jgi:hypothetical protein
VETNETITTTNDKNLTLLHEVKRKQWRYRLCKGYLECFIRNRGDNIIFGESVAQFKEKLGVLVAVALVLVVSEVFSYEILVSNKSEPGFADALETQERDDRKP